MTAPALGFPGSRELAGLWDLLTPHQPHALWVGHLFLHHVEAPVLVHRTEGLDPLAAAVLRTLDLLGAADLDQRDRRLSLGMPLLRRLLDDLTAAGLAEPAPAGRWRASAAGRAAAQAGVHTRVTTEHRVFHFVEPIAPGACPFLNLAPSACRPHTAGAEWAFSANVLRACLARPPDWKDRHGFPHDVDELVPFHLNGTPAEAWARVIIDCAEALPVAVVAVGERRLGFALQPRQWSLAAPEPVFAFSSAHAAAEALGDLLAEPPPEAWRAAWRAWCRQRGLSASDADLCRLDLQDNRLMITPPALMLPRLRAVIGRHFEQAVWLLAGDRPVRRAVQGVIVAGAEPPPAPKARRRPGPGV